MKSREILNFICKYAEKYLALMKGKVVLQRRVMNCSIPSHGTSKIFDSSICLWNYLPSVLITRPNPTPDDGIDAWISPETAGNLL